jgi:hypothetical protein
MSQLQVSIGKLASLLFQFAFELHPCLFGLIPVHSYLPSVVASMARIAAGVWSKVIRVFEFTERPRQVRSPRSSPKDISGM